MIRFLNLHIPVPVLLLGILDVIVVYFSIAGGLALSYAPDSVLYSFFAGGFGLQKSAFVFITLMSLFVIGAYSRAFLTNMKMGLVAICVAHFISLAVLSIAFYLHTDLRIWLSALVPGLLLSLGGIFMTHLAFDRLIGTRLFKRNLLVVGVGPLARRVGAVAERSPYIACVGYLPMGDTKVTIPESLIVREARPLIELARERKVDEIVVALEERRNRLEIEDLLQCRLHGIEISEPSSFIERQDGLIEVDGLYSSWMIFGPGFNSMAVEQRIAKRLFDFGVSFLLLLISLPLMILIALALWASEGNPVLYRQNRVGLNGKIFTIWKFRSMCREAESDGVPRWSSSEDLRVTFLGRLLRRLRMDELPQLWNVLKGEMSFIGPRPERPEFVQQLSAKIPYYGLRHVVKPGISGWAQINLPYGASLKEAQEKLNYDLYYIKNYSLALDFSILLQTLRVIIWPKKGTRETSASVPAAEVRRAQDH